MSGSQASRIFSLAVKSNSKKHKKKEKGIFKIDFLHPMIDFVTSKCFILETKIKSQFPVFNQTIQVLSVLCA